jgi:hypothetical protein
MVNTPIKLYMSGQVTVTCRHTRDISLLPSYFPRLALLLESRATELEGFKLAPVKAFISLIEERERILSRHLKRIKEAD